METFLSGSHVILVLIAAFLCDRFVLSNYTVGEKLFYSSIFPRTLQDNTFTIV